MQKTPLARRLLLFLVDFGERSSRHVSVKLTIRFGCPPPTQRGKAA